LSVSDYTDNTDKRSAETPDWCGLEGVSFPDRRYRHLAERFALRKGSTVRAPRALFASALARSLFVSRELSSFYRTVVASRFPQNATCAGSGHNSSFRPKRTTRMG